MSDENKSQLAQEFAKATEKVKALGEELQGRMTKGEEKLTTLKGDVDEALLLMNELKGKVDELEQKSYRRAGTGEPEVKTLGDKFVQSEAYLNLKQNQGNNKIAKMEVKANITSATTDANGSAGALVNPTRLAGIIAQPEQRLTLRDLIMAGSTDSNAIIFHRETGFTNNTKAQTGEGEKLAQSDIKFDEQTVGVKTLGHFVKISSQILDDASQLASHINGRLLYGLKLVEDRQILNGDGLNNNLKGIMSQATTFADPASMTSYTLIDQLRLAMLQAVLAEYPASGHVLNPIDWAKIELTKDDNGRLIIGNPQGTVTPTLWGVPVVATQAMGAGSFLTGAFSMGAQLFDRQQSTIEVGFENDDFTRMLLTIRATERVALAVYRPEAFIKGTLAEKKG